MKYVFTISAILLTLLSIKPAFSNLLTIDTIQYQGLIKTHPSVISVEVELSTGEQISETSIDSVLTNHCVKLYNLQLFHWVKYEKNIFDNRVDITFIFQERWYLWPIPIFSLADRNISSWITNRSIRRIDFGLHLVHNNFMGRNQKLKSNLQEGYNKKYELFYTIPYIDKNRILGLDFAISTYRSHFIDLNFDKGKPVNMQLQNDFTIRKTYFKAGVFKRKSVNQISRLNFVFDNWAIHDSVYLLNLNFFEPNTTAKNSKQQFLSLEALHTINKQKTFSYPTHGYFLQFGYLGRINLLSGNAYKHELVSDFAFYKQLSQKIHLASGFYANLKIKNTPNFLDSRQLGYKKYVRGFEYFIVHGNFASLQKNGLYYNILKDKNILLKFIKSKKFNTIPVSLYLGPHLDGGYVWEENPQSENIYANKLLVGAGFGIHLVTYYDRVLVFEYTFNNFGNNGFFVSTRFPI